MSQTTAFRSAALFGFCAILLGAFGAHALKDLLLRNGTTAIWEKAVFYHLIHAVVLLMLAGWAPFRRRAWILFACGIVVFSGSLYVLAFTGIKWLGAITPLGGLCFLGGWLLLCLP